MLPTCGEPEHLSVSERHDILSSFTKYLSIEDGLSESSILLTLSFYKENCAILWFRMMIYKPFSFLISNTGDSEGGERPMSFLAKTLK